MPSRAELTQYQKRFLELYSQGGWWRGGGGGVQSSVAARRWRHTHTLGRCFLFAVAATHKETKQFFTLYNTLDDKKVYLEKEVSGGHAPAHMTPPRRTTIT